MRALIFNSGLGSRLGELTADRPKCLVRLASGETILHRQLRVLSSCGIRDFVITTGPFAELVEREARGFEGRGCRFAFVRNERYAETNYLYSFWLARAELLGSDGADAQDEPPTCGDLLMLHGDLVFDAAYVRALVDAPAGSYGSVNRALPQPEKDFKARVIDGLVREVGVGIFDEDCFAFQGLYRLTPEALRTWLDEVGRFVARGETGVYAENAANEVFGQMDVRAFSYERHYVEEVDTPEDLARVSTGIELVDWEAQPALLGTIDGRIEGLASGAWSGACPTDIAALIDALDMRRPLVVADPFFAGRLDQILGGMLAELPVFSDYAPNPRYEQVLAGVDRFRAEGCDGVVSLGGGSAIDVAKCIRLWSAVDGDGVKEHFVELPVPYGETPHLAIPTTAGTGSESTHFAVVYVEGNKVSVAHPLAQPDAALLVPGLLAGLPRYQRASTMLDALCQAIESYWSRRSGPRSRTHSKRAISAIRQHADAYLAGDPSVAPAIMRAANEAGRAINLTTTTAPHAMSYKLTSRYGIAHGHAVALCMGPVWRKLLETADDATRTRLAEIDLLMVASSVNDSTAESTEAHAENTSGATIPLGAGLAAFERILTLADLGTPAGAQASDLDALAASVNAQRLSNHPVTLNEEELRTLYAEALGL